MNCNKMDSIRVSHDIKKIQVNDNGDYIEINFSDQSFASRFFEMENQLNSAYDEVQNKCKEIESRSQGQDQYDFIKELTIITTELHESHKKKIDELFGEDTCRKVFGDILPDELMYIQFFELLAPIFSKFAAQKEQKINKYSAERMGNV